jgi:hypothetical protein
MEYKNIERLRRHELFEYVKEKGLETALPGRKRNKHHSQ